MFPMFDATMTVATLTAIYNGLADKPIKKFADKPTALKRLEALRAELTKQDAAAAVADEPKRTVKDLVLTYIEQGIEAEQIAKVLTLNFPDKACGRDLATAKKHVAWYLCKFRKEMGK